jgi:probable phosphoglycerate mutase
MVELLLIRHGQSVGNVDGTFGSHGPTPLSALGERQAQALIPALTAATDEPLAAIYCSDLPRAVATAQPTAQQLGLTITTDARLRERNVGRFEGLTFTAAEQQFPDAFAALMSRDPDARPPGGETHHECLDRMRAACADIVARHARGRVAIVSHAMALNQLLRALFGIPAAMRAPWFRTDNCAIHDLRFEADGRLQVIALNRRTHLVEVS